MLSSWKKKCLKSPGLVLFVWGKSQIWYMWDFVGSTPQEPTAGTLKILKKRRNIYKTTNQVSVDLNLCAENSSKQQKMLIIQAWELHIWKIHVNGCISYGPSNQTNYVTSNYLTVWDQNMQITWKSPVAGLLEELCPRTILPLKDLPHDFAGQWTLWSRPRKGKPMRMRMIVL